MTKKQGTNGYYRDTIKTFIKKIQNMRDFFNVFYSGTLVHKRVRVKFKVPEYGSSFLSMGPSPQVRVINKQLQYIYLDLDLNDQKTVIFVNMHLIRRS